MRTSEKGIELIKRFEGLMLRAYLCPAGVWTIGYGHTVGVKSNDRVSEVEATELLQSDLIIYENAVKSHNLELNLNQFEALVSFCYNVGAGNLKKSTLLRKAKANPNDPTIRSEFLKWNRGGGKILLGLTRRRIAEADLYFTKP